MAKLDSKIAAKLWDAVVITMERFHAKIVVHEKSTFLGYADITLTAPGLPGFSLKMRGIEAKILKGNMYIDFPSERGADGNFYPQFFPKTAEMRAVLTSAIFADQRVLDTVESAAQAPADEQASAPVAGTETGTPNPFND